MKKEEVYVKLTDKNRERVFKILDMFGEELNFTDNLCRHTLRYESGDSINDYPNMIFYDGYWYLCKGLRVLKKTKVKPRELKQILAKEHLKKGDVVVVKNSMGKWILELTGNNVHKFEFSKSYDKKCVNAPHVRTIEYGIFIRFATEEERKLLQTELQVGKWYTYMNCLLCYQGRDETLKAFGFIRGEWVDTVNCGNNPEKWEEAAPEEVEQAILREAENRGLVAGCLTVSLDDITHFIISECRHPLLSDNLEDGNTLWVKSKNDRGYCIFDNGKWAVPIDKFAGLKQAHKNGAVIQYKIAGEWEDYLDNKPKWEEYNEYRIKPEEPKTPRAGEVCKFWDDDPNYYLTGRYHSFERCEEGYSHALRVCIDRYRFFKNAEPITKEEAIKLLFGNDH